MSHVHFRGRFRLRTSLSARSVREVDVFGFNFPLDIRSKPRAVVVADLHPKGQRLARHVAADATHRDAENLSLRIVAHGRRGVGPGSGRRGAMSPGHGQIRRSPEDEDGHVGGGIVGEGRGRVGHADTSGRAGGDVDLVVTCAHVADETEGARGARRKLARCARHPDAREGSVRYYAAVKGSRGRLCEKVIPACRLGRDYHCHLADGGPGQARPVRRQPSASSVSAGPRATAAAVGRAG